AVATPKSRSRKSPASICSASCARRRSARPKCAEPALESYGPLSFSVRTLIKHVLASTEPKEQLTAKGWVRTRRDSKGFSFLELNDGSCLKNLQVIVDAGTPGSEDLPQLTTGAAIVVEG